MRKLIIYGLIAIGALILFAIFNPTGYNESTERTVVTSWFGSQRCVFEPGPYWAGPFANETSYPNQIGIQYKADKEDLDLIDNTIDIGKTTIQFLGGASATVTGIVQFTLPNDEKSMLDIHNSHKSIEGLVKRRLAPYTQECLSASAQLLTPEAHYNGGKAQMTQNYLDQLRNGSFLLEIDKITTYDTLEKSNKSEYTVRQQKDKDGNLKRKFSSIKEYNILVGDAQITSTDYEDRIDNMLGKQIEAQTAASVARQQLMTAQQQGLTAEAQGKKTLVEIEYKQKQDQTRQVVAAQTLVELAQKDLEKQSIMEKAATKEASKIKILADANAYEKQRDIQANGALEQKLDAYVKVMTAGFKAMGEYGGNWVPTYMSGNTGGIKNGAIEMMDILGLKAARDLSLDLKTK